MYNPKAIRKEQAKRHFKRIVRKDAKNGCLVEHKRKQFSYDRTLRVCVHRMFPQYKAQFISLL